MSGRPFDDVLTAIEKGIADGSVWIPVRYPSLRHQFGIANRLYHLVGGDPGTGKTSFVDQTYVLDAHHWAGNNPDKVKLKTVYFSMERSQVYKKTKWTAHRMYTHSNILRSVPDLLNWGTAKKPADESILTVARSHDDYFNQLFDDVYIIDGANNPTGVYKILYDFALQHGTLYGRDAEGNYWKTTLQSWSRSQAKDRKIKISAQECPVQLKNYQREFIPDNPNLIIQVVLDHIGKVRSESGLNDKQTIDKMSEYLCMFRDLFGMAVVLISQFNRNNANIQRRINTDLSPEQQDFKGSGNTYEDADVVLGLFNPHKHGLKKYKGYDINKTRVNNSFSRFRSVSLLKNSYGVDNLIAGFKFVGECGYFDQIPTPTNVNYEEIFND